MITEETEFRKQKILVIKDEQGKRLWSGGFKKIKAILENIEALKAFFDKYNINH